MEKYPEIEQFRHVLRNVTWKSQFQGLDANNEPIMDRLAKLPILTYGGTVKIHGCCSSIRIEGDKFTCQSRNQEISPENDNYGFAKFIHSIASEIIQPLKNLFGDNVTIHGEWAGKGIQDTVAVNQLERFWTIFGVKPINEIENNWLDIKCADIDLTDYFNERRIYFIPQFGTEKVNIDFENPAESINELNKLSLLVENECPVAKFFGVSGIGEGRVWKPIDKEYNSSKYIFKVKGQLHSQSKVKKLASVDIEKMKSIEDFVNKHLSEERLMQSWRNLIENKLELSEKSTGAFIKWCHNDIIKEENDELMASNLTQKDLGGMVAKKAKEWFFRKILDTDKNNL